MFAALISVSLAQALPPAATVLNHTVSISIDARRQLQEEVTWVVRVEDPVACSAGILAPPGLDGASSGGARVFEELLVVPEDTREGSTFSFRQVRQVPPGEHSGVFLSAPDLPTERASITVDIPTNLPLTVWADPSSVPTYDTRKTRRVTFAWSGLARDATAQAAWSTHESWQVAGVAVESIVSGKLVSKDGLGRTWAEGIEGLGLAGVTERAYEAVALEPGAGGSWATARPAAEVLKARSGTAAERGLVLISMLKLAGIEARPGYARPAQARGDFPATVPAPSLLPRPILVVRRPTGDVYIDPAAERATVPERPASLLGATVWVPGELPARLPELGVVDGAVSVNSTLTFAPDGSASFNAAIQATGAAQEFLRDLLAPLDEAGRTEALRRLVQKARPELQGIAVTASGVEKPSKALKISVSASQSGLLQTMPFGLRGEVPPVLAPALAAWLPPRLAVQEILSVTPPSAVQILGTAGPASVVHPDAIVTRAWKREGQKLTFRTEVERPYRATTPARDTSADAFLTAEAQKGVELLMFSSADSTSAKAVRTATSLTPEDRAVLEALLWYSNNQDKKAFKTLERALPVTSFAALVGGLEHWSDPTDLRPWNTLSDLALADADRMTIAEGLEVAGARPVALQRAAGLCTSADPDVKIRALLMVERLQGPPPAAGAPPPEPAWQSPMQLLALARDAAEKAPSSPAARRVAWRLAELQIEAGDTAGAEATLDRAERNALAEALRAYAAAVGGVPRDEVEAAITIAVAKDPTDPWLLAIASDAIARVGGNGPALEYALSAARLARTDPQLWALAGERALASGDLRTAVDASRRASDLDVENNTHAARWATLSALIDDRDAVDAARLRAGLPPIEAWPPSLDDKLASDESAMYAVLEGASSEVAANPRLLAMRAQMRIERGALDEAARDGMLLATLHDRPEGWALAFAATAGRQYSTPASAALDRAAKTELTAQSTRMEYRLITGSGDPLEDARRLGTDPRAVAVSTAATTPAAAAALVEGWPASGLTTPVGKPPAGFRPNKALTGPGWVGWSSPDAAASIVRVGGVTGLLPPPLGAMYTPKAQAVRRLPDGTQVLALDGGIIPLFAAVRVVDGTETWGLGFTHEAAITALQRVAP
jgi:hypothetical protein